MLTALAAARLSPYDPPIKPPGARRADRVSLDARGQKSVERRVAAIWAAGVVVDNEDGTARGEDGGRTSRW